MAMRAGWRLVAVTGVAILLGAGAAPRSAGVKEVEGLYDAGKFSDAIAAAKRVLAKPGVPHEDRHVVMVLAAESHLQLKERETAVDVLNAAHREAVKEDRPRDAAETEAFAVLIPESPGNVYAGKYHLLDGQDRKQAYVKVFGERLQHVQSILDSAEREKSFKPIDDIADYFPLTREFEEAGTGEVKQSDAFADQVEKQAGEREAGMLEEDDKEIARIQEKSNINAAGKIDAKKPAGISEEDRGRLQEMLKACEGFPQEVKGWEEAFRRAWPMPKVLAKAKDTGNRVGAMLAQDRRVGKGREQR